MKTKIAAIATSVFAAATLASTAIAGTGAPSKDAASDCCKAKESCCDKGSCCAK